MQAGIACIESHNKAGIAYKNIVCLLFIWLKPFQKGWGFRKKILKNKKVKIMWNHIQTNE